MPSNASLAIVAGLVCLTAGCLSPPGASPSTTPPEQVATEPPESEVVELPSGPKERPDWPETLDKSSVREYVRSYEYNYVYNNLYQGEYTEMSLECSVDTIAVRSSAYEVVVSCTGSSTTDPPSGSTATPGVHADWFTQSFRYRVSGDSVSRTRAD